MASTSSISSSQRTGLFLRQDFATKSTDATRPGHDPQTGKPLGDKDVYEPKRTAAGERIDTSDGISKEEGVALSEIAVESSVEFMHKLSADSSNGTEVKYHFEQPVERVGTAFADFTARDSNVLIECGISVSSETVKEALKEYMAADEKQNNEPIVGKLKITAKINEQGELSNIQCEASVANLPKLSAEKLGEFEKNVGKILEQMPVGQTITEEMKTDIGERVKAALKRTSNVGLEFFKELMESAKVFKIDVAGEKSASKAHLTGGQNALDIQVDHALDEAGQGYPRIDGHTKLGLDKDDSDTVDLGKPRIYSTENLLVSFEGNKPKLFRVEADGTRTPLNDIFGQILFGLPLVIAMLSGKKLG